MLPSTRLYKAVGRFPFSQSCHNGDPMAHLLQRPPAVEFLTCTTCKQKLFLLTTHPLHILSLYYLSCLCPLPILFVHYLFCICQLPIPSLSSTHPIFVNYLSFVHHPSCICPLPNPSLSTTYSLFNTHPVFVQYLSCLCPLPILCLSTT